MQRKWTDAELRAAVESHHSWRATARALGLKDTSAGTIRALKRRATALGLDASHFVGQRTWTDRHLRDAIASADTWSGVLRALDLADRGEVRVRLRGYAVRSGIDISHLDPARPDRPNDLSVLVPKASMLRLAAEPFAVAWFAMRGVPVAVPAQPCAYDLLVTLPSGVQRVQVKTTASKRQLGTSTVMIGRRPYVLDKSAAKVPYDPSELDYFFVIDGDDGIYFIPSSVVAGRTSINVGAYAAFCVGNASSLFVQGSRHVPQRPDWPPDSLAVLSGRIPE